MSQLIHSRAAQSFARLQIESEKNGVVVGPDGDPLQPGTMCRPFKHIHVVFEVVADLQHRIVGEQRAQPGQRIPHRDLVGLFGEHVAAAMGKRDIAGPPRRGGETDSDKARRDGVERVGFGIDGEDTA